jgi:hypothetical protein
MAYRLGELAVDDREAGTLSLQGDGFAAAGETASLLDSAGVQRYLGMSRDEAAAAQALARRYRDAVSRAMSGRDWQPPQLDPATAAARRELDAGVERLLGAARARKLERLSLRIRGADALADDRVASTLALTGEQRERIASLARDNEAAQARVASEFANVRLAGRDALQRRGVDAHRSGERPLLDVLTPQQRAAFERMLDDARAQ